MANPAKRAALHDWLLNDAKMLAGRSALVGALGERLLDCGVPVARITTGVPLLHPVLDTSSVLWEPGTEPVERLWRMQPENYNMLANSPLKIVYDGGGPVRSRIGPEPEAGEFGIIADLRASGMRDYLVAPAPFSDGATKAVTFATRADAGFSEEDVQFLVSLCPTLAMILEIQTLRRTSRTFLETYLGADAGRRVLEGTVKRGMGEFIPSAIMFCDLRGFTDLSGRLASDGLLALLNDYFDVMTAMVAAHQGEVLKFMGDAVLAIFAHEAEASARDAAGRALDAAAAAQARISELNVERSSAGAPEIRCGIALHDGEVLYGNIGGRDRLDFTVIGPAVNLTSRIEKLCGDMGEPVLMSSAFATLLARPLRSVGRHGFKGVKGLQEVFAPA